MSHPTLNDVDHYAVAGHPVSHSQSPFIHAMFAAATQQTLRYGRLLCPLDEGGFATVIRAFAAAPGGSVGEFDAGSAVGTESAAPAERGAARGCNVTVPFKFEAFALGARVTARAALAQASNLLRFDAEGWLADNTDGAGLVRDIEHNAVDPSSWSSPIDYFFADKRAARPAPRRNRRGQCSSRRLAKFERGWKPEFPPLSVLQPRRGAARREWPDAVTEFQRQKSVVLTGGLERGRCRIETNLR